MGQSKIEDRIVVQKYYDQGVKIADIVKLISADEWPASPPDCNPLDYAIWGMLEPIVNAKQHRSLDALKRKLKEEWKKLPKTVIRLMHGVGVCSVYCVLTVADLNQIWRVMCQRTLDYVYQIW